MHQGKVVAVRPAGSRFSDTEELYNSPVQASIFRGKKNKKLKGQIVFIKVFKDKISIPRNSERVVWYDDPSGRLKIGNTVSFEIDENMNKVPIEGAVNLEKNLQVFPAPVLSKIVLFASTYFLISALLKDNQGTRQETTGAGDYR